MNFFESLLTISTCTLIAGIYYPWVAVGLGAAWIIGRMIYTRLYKAKGPNGRLIGFFICFTTGLAMQVTAILSGLRMENVF